jgi:S1-C subfamily serine protease
VLGAWLVLACLVTIGCSGGSGGSVPGSIESDERGGAACRPDGDEKPAKALVRCGETTIAYVTTDWAGGTGVLIEVSGRRYVLTNLHVVDPFATADATVGGENLEDLPVVGADVATDIALLGPLDGDGPTLPVTDGDTVEKGDDVFAVGYPGEVSTDDVELTVTSGIVSRLRDVPAWDQTYIQTDARVADGQSGGPLFDAGGNLVGITGLGFEGENFGLALIGSDVRAAAERVAAGDGDDLLTVPATADPQDGTPPTGGTTSGQVQLTDAADVATLFLPPSTEDRTWNLGVPDAAGTVVVDVADGLTLDPLAVSASSAAVGAEVAGQVAARAGGDAAALAEEAGAAFGQVPPGATAAETSPGSFTLEIEAGASAEVSISAPLATAPTGVAWTSDQALWPLSGPIDTVEASVGEEVEGVFLTYDATVDVAVPLEAGQELEVVARTPQGDVDVAVLPPGTVVDALVVFDPEAAGLEVFVDSDEGLYGLDVREPFAPETSGTYRFRVTSFDGVPVAWRFQVVDCSVGDCG